MDMMEKTPEELSQWMFDLICFVARLLERRELDLNFSFATFDDAGDLSIKRDTILKWLKSEVGSYFAPEDEENAEKSL